jgi:hypothetical protein
MQEGTPMVVDPLSISYQMPWEARLFILYLLVIVTMSLVKSARVVHVLWLSKRGSLQKSSTEGEFVLAWEGCSNKVQSVKRWVFVVAAMLLRREFMFFMAQKMFWSGAFFQPTVEVLTVFVLGILVCAALYTICAVCEGALLGRRESWIQAHSSTQNQLKG